MGVDPRLDGVVDFVGSLGAGTLGDTEDTHQLVGHPIAHGSAVVDGPMGTESAPSVAVVLFGHVGPGDRDAKRRQVYPVGMHQPVDVVIRGQQQAGRVVEGRVLGNPDRRNVTVWGDDREITSLCIDPSGDLADRFVGRE